MVDTTVDLQTIPLSALRLKSRNALAIYLDALKILPSSDGLSRDWRGVCHLSALNNQCESFLSSKANPTIELIKMLENEPHHTFASFRKILGDIDRWDVVDDTYEMFVEDAVEYLKKKEKFDRNQEQSVEISKRNLNPEDNILTIDDMALAEKNLPLQQYDAFILFADEDIDFAAEMIEKIEASGSKLCVKERDFLAGLSFEHAAIRKLLTERCGRLVVILSPDFVNSPLNGFISNLAQSLGIAQKKRKIIPCLYKPVEKLPEVFQHIHLLNYHRPSKLYDFWEKLKHSLKSTPEEILANPEITITDVDQTTVSRDNSVSMVEPTSVNVVAPTRQRNRKTSQSQKFMDVPSLPSPPASDASESSIKFFPPSPKLRSSASMVNLTDLDSTETNNNLDNGRVEERSKKNWFQKLSHTLNPSHGNLKLSGSESNLSKEKKPKSKKKIKIGKLFRVK